MTRSVKILFVLVFFVLSGFYLYVLNLTRHPHMSMTFKMYYLDQSIHFWSRNQTLAYIPGTEMSLVPYRDRCFYLSRAGWEIPEKDGTGTLFNGDGGLLFTLHSDPGSLIMVSNVTTLSDNTELTVSIGKAWSKTLTLTKAGPQHLSIQIPAGLLIADPETPNYVSLHSNHIMKFQSFNFTRAE